MFIKLHGVKNIRMIINIDEIKAIQEITEDSKHAIYLESGAKTLIHIDDKLLPIKESIIQVENKLKKLGALGGAGDEG